MLKVERYLIVMLLAIAAYSCNTSPKSGDMELNVMSFNIWVGGGKSIAETKNVWVNSKADIIGVQESTRDDENIAVRLADSLGWYSYEYAASQTIVSKYPIVDTTTNKHGVKIKIDNEHFVWMFNVHLSYCPYEPYQLNGIEYCGGPILQTEEEAIASAWATRGAEVNSNLADIEEARRDGYPIFLTGDFNEPSCLDWTARAVEAKLCKIAVKWPATSAFMNRGELKDSYRLIYPDEVKNPGHTWTTLPETAAYTEVPDRIDFVLFSGDKVELRDSKIIGEESDRSDVGLANYPSDHRAVLSTFVLRK